MMETGEILMELTELARRRPEIRKALLQTADSDRPLSELCRISTELGYPLYEMELISAAEDYYAAMRRSTNGGGENSPMLEGEDDYYELFLSDLRQIGK